MGWKIPEIKIRVPEVRAPKAKAARVMPKPRVKKAASGKIDGFSLTIFSRGKGVKKEITQIHIEVIRALLASDGNRTIAAQRLGVTDVNVSQHAKNIRDLTDTQLQKYADKLNATADEIKRVCADFNPKKGTNHIEIIRALLASDGNRKGAAKKLGISHGNVSERAKDIRGSNDIKLQEYANKLNTTVGEIKRVCADFTCTKGITHIQIIRELLAANGNRKDAAWSLGVDKSFFTQRAKNIMRLRDTELQKYADQLSEELKRKITIYDIRNVAAPRRTGKINFERRIQIIRELLASDGSRTTAAQRLGFTDVNVSHHAKNIQSSADAQLQKYADKLNTTVEKIRFVCADFNPRKGITHIEAIRALIASGGNRTAAAKNLRTNNNNVSKHAKNIMRLPDAKLDQYAAELGVSVEQIRNVCAPRVQQAKGKLFKK